MWASVELCTAERDNYKTRYAVLVEAGAVGEA